MNDQLTLFPKETLPEDDPMQGISIAEARIRAQKELQDVRQEKRIPFGIAFLGVDNLFGLSVLVVKFRGDVAKYMGREDSVQQRWDAI